MENKLLGALALTFLQRTRPSDPTQVEFLQDVAHQVALGMENARLFSALSQMASTDELTRLANRRRFTESLRMEMARMRRSEAPLSLIMADADHLKAINDAHGHPAGDAAIRHVAEAIRRGGRETDMAARLGGEEFALLLPGTDAVAFLTRCAPYGTAPRPSFVVLDFRLPDMNAPEVLARLRGEPQLADLPILVLSQAGWPEDAREALAAGASAFVVKPSRASVIAAARPLGPEPITITSGSRSSVGAGTGEACMARLSHGMCHWLWPGGGAAARPEPTRSQTARAGRPSSRRPDWRPPRQDCRKRRRHAGCDGRPDATRQMKSGGHRDA